MIQLYVRQRNYLHKLSTT